MKELIKLFTAFFRIGLFTFGGGYSMLPMLQREVVEHYGWATPEDLLDYFAIGQCTPGIIAVNTATLVGAKQRGILGALFATLGVITPSIIIILIIAAVLERFLHLPAVAHAFGGVRVAVAALIVSAVIRLFRANVLPEKGAERRSAAQFLRACWLPLLLCLLAFCSVAILGASPVYMILGAVLAGLLLYKRGGA